MATLGVKGITAIVVS